MPTELATDFERWLSHILAVASVARQRPGEWAAIRRTWTPGVPVTGSHVGDAVHPSEVREVLLALRAAYESRLPPERPGEDDAMWQFRHRRIVDFVRDETEAYIARVTPRPAIGALFARAAAPTPLQSSSPVESGPSVNVRTCRWCGAPRQIESIYGNCAFCGTPFFPRSS